MMQKVFKLQEKGFFYHYNLLYNFKKGFMSDSGNNGCKMLFYDSQHHYSGAFRAKLVFSKTLDNYAVEVTILFL